MISVSLHNPMGQAFVALSHTEKWEDRGKMTFPRANGASDGLFLLHQIAFQAL